MGSHSWPLRAGVALSCLSNAKERARVQGYEEAGCSSCTIVHILLPSTVTPRRRPEPQREDGVDQEEEDGAVSESLTTDCRRDLLYE